MASDPNDGFLFDLVIHSDPELLCVVRGAVQGIAEVAGLSEAECRCVTLAVDEAVANIIRHAYDCRRDQPIEVRCRRLPAHAAGRGRAALEFLLVDRGRSADPAELQGRPLDQVRPGGLGMHFIRQSMDEVDYQACEDGNRLRLLKYLAPGNSRSGA